MPYFDRAMHLPRLVLDETIILLCAHLTRTYQDSVQFPQVVTGGLAVWQQDRAIELLHEHLDGELALPDLAKECGLSPGRFMRAFKKSFGVPVRPLLALQDEFKPRSRCCCTPINHCLRLHWKWGFLINQPSIEASARLSEHPRGSGEEQMRRCQKHSNCLPSSKGQNRLP